MPEFVVALALGTCLWVAVRLLIAAKRQREAETRRLPGQLTAQERRRLYARLRIDPATLGLKPARALWRDPTIIDRRTDA